MLGGFVAIPAIALLAIAIAVGVVLALNGDVADLRKRVRAASHAEQALRAEVEAMRDVVAQLRDASASPNAEIVQAPPAAAPEPVASAAPALRKVKTYGTTVPHCVFRAGDPDRLADCIRAGYR